MGLQIKREFGVNQIPVFQKEFEVAQGGFKLDITGLPSGEIVTPATPMGFDEVARKATVLKSAVLVEAATDATTGYKVKKGHFLVVGEDVGADEGGAAYAITSIDKTNANYDVVTLATTLGVALDAGHVLFKSSANGADVAALHVTPKGLLFDNVKIEDNVSCAVVLRGTVYKRRIANGIPEAVQSALHMITFSESY